MPQKPFLTARWESLLMVNYEIDPAILNRFVPRGTELDEFDGKTFVSMVGFLFLQIKIKGIAIPFHQNFEEINLRFYVRRKAGNEWRRGVVFIKEIVPKFAIATVARLFYNENYVTMPTKSTVIIGENGAAVEYLWKTNGIWCRLSAASSRRLKELAVGSEEEFITEHYHGYSAQRDGGTVEYKVDHPRWRYWKAGPLKFDCKVEELYGSEFSECLAATPSSVFIAEGSEVTVYQGCRI